MRENLRDAPQLAAAAVCLAAACLAAGCSSAPAQDPAPTAAAGHAAASAAPLPPDPRTAPALLKIATVFNNEYDSGDYGPVYARWDARSQAVITRAQYIKRHKDCPSAPHAAALVRERHPGPARGVAGGL